MRCRRGEDALPFPAGLGADRAASSMLALTRAASLASCADWRAILFSFLFMRQARHSRSMARNSGRGCIPAA